jgi:hypothetical protein
MFASQAITIPSWIVQSIIVLILGGGFTVVMRAIVRSFKAWITEQFQQLFRTTQEVVKQVTPNGGDTDSNGDITKRIEKLIETHVQQDLEIQERQGEDLKALRKDMKRLCNEIAYHSTPVGTKRPMMKP